MLGVIRHTLQQAGFIVTTAENGSVAWELLLKNDFDLVVTDFQMPGLTGIALCEAMRTERRLEHTPVIFVTAKLADLGDAQIAALRINAVISKPFSPREMVRVVEDVLESSTARSAGAGR